MPRDITPSGIRLFEPNRHPLPEDDNTFAPPALSAYSIALLSDKHTNAPEVSIYDLELRENESLKRSLKSKFSVHFKEANSAQSTKSDQNTQNHSTSSNHNVTTTSNNSSNSFSSTHTPIEDHDDFMDISGETMGKPLHSTTTTPGGSVTLLYARPSSSSLPSVKRSRLARRFTSLGPPKRASEVSADQLIEDMNAENPTLISPPVLSTSSSNNEAAAGSAVTPSEMSIETPSKLKSPDYARNGKRIVTNDSSFFKGLDRLRQASPGLNLLAPAVQPREEIPRQTGGRQHDFNVFLDKKTVQAPASNSLRTSPYPRIPLTSISPSTFNVGREPEGFRKPKAPRLSFREETPQSMQRFPTARISEQPAVMNHPIVSTDDSKRRKIIHINLHQYEKLELIGRGGTSKVYKVRSLSNKKAYAIKKVTFDQFDDACVRCFKGEIELLSQLKDEPRVVRLVDHAISDGTIYLVMECGDLDLAHVLLTNLGTGTSLDINFVRFHAMELLKCLEAVHRAGIVHSDLKPANFLFVRGVLKIIDFGIANAVPDHTANVYRESQIGTPNYMAPEALVDIGQMPNKTRTANTWKVGRPSDIWSCGCIIYQMIYGRPPFASYTGQLKYMAIINPQVKIEYPTTGIGGTKVPQSSIELMKKCLARNPSDRWTVDQCLDSDFLRPRAVNRTFVRDLVYSAVNFGYNSRKGGISEDVYDKLVDTVLKQIEDLNYA